MCEAVRVTLVLRQAGRARLVTLRGAHHIALIPGRSRLEHELRVSHGGGGGRAGPSYLRVTLTVVSTGSDGGVPRSRIARE